MAFQIVLEKENFKFSCSHFTILSPTAAERLHGHNYYVRITLDVDTLDSTLGMAFDFNEVKPLVRETLDRLDERVLLPMHSPYLTIETSAESVVARLELGSITKRYELPLDDVHMLETVNVTSEELARLLAERLATRMRESSRLKTGIKALSVSVEETRGQSVCFSLKM